MSIAHFIEILKVKLHSKSKIEAYKPDLQLIHGYFGQS